MDSLSIVIPVVGSSADVETSLLSALENRPDNAEVVLVHAASFEDPYDLQDEVRFVLADTNNPTVMFNQALATSDRDQLLWLSAGHQLTHADIVSASNMLAADDRLAAVVPRVSSGDTQCFGVKLDRRNGKRLCPQDAAQPDGPLLGTGLFRRTSLRFMHGFDTRLGSLADVEMGLRLRSAGYAVGVDRNFVVQAANQPAATPERGSLAARRRGLLLRTASELGLASSVGLWQAIWAECLIHRASPRGLAAGWARATIAGPAPATLPKAAAARVARGTPQTQRRAA